jgi:hypothetical protein
MTDSQVVHPDIVRRYVEGLLDFKGLVTALFDAGLRPREAYALAKAEEDKKMQRIALRARAIAETDRRTWGE